MLEADTAPTHPLHGVLFQSGELFLGTLEAKRRGLRAAKGARQLLQRP